MIKNPYYKLLFVLKTQKLLLFLEINIKKLIVTDKKTHKKFIQLNDFHKFRLVE